MSRHGARATILALVLAVTMAACGNDGTLRWRDVIIDLPAAWVEIDRTTGSLTVADAEPAGEPGVRGDMRVATQFTWEPNTTAADWRRLIADQGGTIEQDHNLHVQGVGATLIQFAWASGGTPTRERVILIPSRDIVILQQPVPMQGDTEAPDWFFEHLDQFDAILDGLTFRAPDGYLDR